MAYQVRDKTLVNSDPAVVSVVIDILKKVE